MSTTVETPPVSTDPPLPRQAAARLLAIASIKASPTNPRKYFDKEQLEELADSIRKHGVLQPVLVRPRPKDLFELIAGERRLRAAKAAGLTEIPALVRELADAEVLEIQVIENLQRSDLHPLEEADGYHALMRSAKYDVAKLAERVGRSTTYIYDRVKLLSLTKEAQDLFRAGKIQAGHAVLLARLKPADQERAIDPRGLALFQAEHTLFHPEKDDEDDPADDYAGMKTRSVRELAAWIDEHVRLDVAAPDLPDLFPTAAQVITQADEQAEKVVSITHEHFIKPEARTDERVIGPKSWKRADKPCDSAVTGVVVVGPGRGEAFKVCVDKKRCATHWGTEIRAAKKRADEVSKGGKTGEDRYEIQRRKQEEENKRVEARRARWEKGRPAVLKAMAEAIKKASIKPGGIVADMLISLVETHGSKSEQLATYVKVGSNAEDLLRHLAFITVARHAHGWSAYQDFPKLAKKLGVDAGKILDEAVPEATPEPRPATTDTAVKKPKPAAKPKKK